MATNTSIDIGAVNEAIGYMNNMIKKINSAQEYADQATSEARGGWESSQAAPDFLALLAKWNGKVPTLLQDTQDILAFLQSARDQYLEAERKL